MSLTPTQILLTISVLTAAGCVQGMSGFGFGLVAVTILSGLIPLKQASVILVLASLSLNIFILSKLWKHFLFERMKWLLTATIIGVPFGVWLLVKAEKSLLKRILGTVLLITVIQGLIPALKKRPWHQVWGGSICGLFSGALSGAFATGGPPAVAYVQSQQFDRFRYAASVQLPLAIAAVVRIICLISTGAFTRQIAAISITAVVCALFGCWAGLHFLKKLPDKTIRKIVLTMLFIMGLKFSILG